MQKKILLTNFSIIFLLLASIFISSCGGARKIQPAPIEIGHGIKGGSPYLDVITKLKELSKNPEKYIVKNIYSKEQTDSKSKKIKSCEHSSTTIMNKQKNNIPNQIKVKKGDSLVKIADKYNITMEEIADLNAISPPYDLQPEQILYLK